ncbi:MAG TPA: hypothetical protein VFK36_07665 [Gemmatimonadales bacterium]|nr:hypothetical protein [Gemmatimonadales bacterium]
MTSARALPTRPSVAGRIAATALIVAALDFFYVLVRWVWLTHALTVQELAQSIATGLLGRAAYDGGPATAVLGLGLHLLVAFGWTLVFFLLTARVAGLRKLISTMRGRMLLGLAWGPIIWLLMDFVVLPLSQAHPTPTSSPTFYINLLQHALMIGLPMAVLLGAER